MEGLLVHFMLYSDEVRENENKVPKDIEVRPKELQLAKQLVENLSEPLKLEAFEDEYIQKLEELIESKLKGRKLTVIKPKVRPKVVDLMEALQKSVQQTKKGSKRPAARAEAQTGTRLKKAAR
jgi:DNA end-binding protein Ku